MPTMPRVKNKATKIAYKILGMPANIRYNKRPFDKKINKRLIFEETARVR